MYVDSQLKSLLTYQTPMHHVENLFFGIQTKCGEFSIYLYNYSTSNYSMFVIDNVSTCNGQTEIIRLQIKSGLIILLILIEYKCVIFFLQTLGVIT